MPISRTSTGAILAAVLVVVLSVVSVGAAAGLPDDGGLLGDDSTDDGTTTDGITSDGTTTDGTTTDGSGTDGSTNDTTDTTTDLVNDTTDTTGDTLNDTTTTTTDTVDDTTDTTTDTVDDTTDTTSDTVDDTTETLEGASDGDATGTVNDTTETVDDTTGDVTGTVDGTVDDTTDAVDDTTDSATNATSDTVDSATDSADSTIDSAEDATGTDGTLSDTTENVTGTVDDTAEGLESTVDGAEQNATGTVDEAVGGATDATDDTVDGATDTVDGATATVAGDTDGTLGGADGDGDAGGADRDSAGATDEAGASDGPAAAGTESVRAVGSESDDGDVVPMLSVPTKPGDLPEPTPENGAAVGLLAIAGAALGRHSSEIVSAAGAVVPIGTRSAVATARTGLWDRLVRFFAPFRYSRYDDSDPLENDARAEVYDAVTDDPGVYLSAVGERTDLSLSSVRHHVRVLEREDLLMAAKVRGKRRYYPAYTENVELAAALSEDATAAIIDALSTLGPSSVSALADELDRDPSTVTHHCKRLEEDGIVVRERDGRAVLNRLSDETERALTDPDPAVTDDAIPAGEAAGAD